MVASTKITYAELPEEVKTIAQECLGHGVLRSLFSYTNTYHLILKISDGIVVGFALYHFRTTVMADGHIDKTGILDCVCVSPVFRGEGFGSTLTFNALKKMSIAGASRVELILKMPDYDDRDMSPGFPAIGSEKFLEDLGFRLVEVFPNFYKSRSERYDYVCAFCGNSPDTCQARLYCR